MKCLLLYYILHISHVKYSKKNPFYFHQLVRSMLAYNEAISNLKTDLNSKWYYEVYLRLLLKMFSSINGFHKNKLNIYNHLKIIFFI